MKFIFRTLVKCLVKPFYQQLAGVFLFAMIILFGAVGKLNGQDVLGYHLFLIRGILSSASFFFIIFFCWFLYARYCCRYVWNNLADPAFQFLFLLDGIDRRRKLIQLFLLHALLFLPVIAYALVMVSVACYLHRFAAAAGILIYLLVVVFFSSGLTVLKLNHPGKQGQHNGRSFFFRQGFPTGYGRFFLRFLFTCSKALYGSLKLLSIGMLWFLVRGQHHDATEIKMPLVLFSVFIFGHGLILHAWRAMETQKMIFLPGLPYRLLTRFLQASIICLLLLSPETILLFFLTPGQISCRESFLLWACGYSLLLAIHSLLFLGKMDRTDYFKLTGCVYFIFFMAVLAGLAGWMSLVLLILAIVIFYGSYYRYE